MIFRKLCAEQEFFELAHHGRLADDWRVQSADDFEQESIGLLAAKDFDGGQRHLAAFNWCDCRCAFVGVENQDAAQAGLPFEAIENRGHLFPRFVSKIDDDQLVDHAVILENL